MITIREAVAEVCLLPISDDELRIFIGALGNYQNLTDRIISLARFFSSAKNEAEKEMFINALVELTDGPFVEDGDWADT